MYRKSIKFNQKGGICIEKDTLPFDFGLRLKKLRKSKCLSQEGAAKRLGVSKNTIYRYENNLMEPTRERLVKLAIVYNTSIDYICGLIDEDPLVLYGLTQKQQTNLMDLVQSFKNSELAQV